MGNGQGTHPARPGFRRQMEEARMANEPGRDKPEQELPVAGPGSIAARQIDPPHAPDMPPPMPQGRAGSPAVGTPGASDQAGIAPATDGLSGQLTNDQMPDGGATSPAERTAPDMQEAPDPRGDARDPPPR